jgi:glycosyltransferase involved in cell wall biosynthesis
MEPSASPGPTVSVVIATLDRPGKIPQAVASVLANNYPAFDLTVVDQSTTDETGSALREVASADPRLHYLHVTEAGLSRARNTGIRETTGDIIAFTDDDCVVSDHWVDDIVAAFASDREGALLYGCVQPLPDEDNPNLTPFLKLEAPERLSRTDGFRVVGMGANFAARRCLFGAIGGFDETLGCGGPLRAGEDFDFAYRTYRSGAVILLRPEVSVLHDGRRERSDWPGLVRNYGIGDGAFYSKHIRCGDWYAMQMLSGRVARLGTRVAAKRIIGQWTDEDKYLRGLFSGVRQGMRFRVDRRSRKYVARH